MFGQLIGWVGIVIHLHNTRRSCSVTSCWRCGRYRRVLHYEVHVVVVTFTLCRHHRHHARSRRCRWRCRAVRSLDQRLSLALTLASLQSGENSTFWLIGKASVKLSSSQKRIKDILYRIRKETRVWNSPGWHPSSWPVVCWCRVIWSRAHKHCTQSRLGCCDAIATSCSCCNWHSAVPSGVSSTNEQRTKSIPVQQWIHNF